MRTVALFAASTALVTAVAAGCGGSEPPPEAPPPPAPPARHEAHRPSLAVQGQLGSLDQGKVEQTFSSLLPKLGDCISRASAKVEFIGGHVKFFVRIGQDGSAKWAYLSESNLGDRGAEKCMVDTAKATRWPPPIGGEGQAQKAFDFDPSPDVREPVSWDPDRVSKALAGAHEKLSQCREGTRGGFHATAYVHPDGKVLAAGIAPPDDRGDNAADCLVDVIKGLKFPSPGSWTAKVEFDLR